MAPHEDSPLGQLVMPIRVRLLVSTPELANELAGSGVKIAMDNYPIILHPFSFLCLLKHKIFVVGTVRRNHKGMAGALDMCCKTGGRLRKRGNMNFARSGGGDLSMRMERYETCHLCINTSHQGKRKYNPFFCEHGRRLGDRG